MAKAKKAKAKARKPALPAAQWKLPATYTGDRKRLASFAEMIDPNTLTRSLTQLSKKELAEVVAKRIAAQPKFELMMLGAGVVDKERAIAEVKAQSDVGRILMEIEQRAILMAEQIAREGLAAAQKAATAPATAAVGIVKPASTVKATKTAAAGPARGKKKSTRRPAKRS